MICPKCNGTDKKIYNDNGINYEGFCDFCRGKKDLDWIEYVIGVDSSYHCSGYSGITGYGGGGGYSGITGYGGSSGVYSGGNGGYLGNSGNSGYYAVSGYAPINNQIEEKKESYQFKKQKFKINKPLFSGGGSRNCFEKNKLTSYIYNIKNICQILGFKKGI